MGKGRPKGVKETRPRQRSSLVRRDLEWAWRHMGDDQAIPPTPGAKYFQAMAKEDKNRFTALVVKYDNLPQSSRAESEEVKDDGTQVAVELVERLLQEFEGRGK